MRIKDKENLRTLFTWTHPLASTLMSHDSEEAYVGNMLVRLEIDMQNVRAIRVRQQSDVPNTDTLDLSDIDLVEHIYEKTISESLLEEYPRLKKEGYSVGDRAEWFREWVIINQRAI